MDLDHQNNSIIHVKSVGTYCPSTCPFFNKRIGKRSVLLECKPDKTSYRWSNIPTKLFAAKSEIPDTQKVPGPVNV